MDLMSMKGESDIGRLNCAKMKAIVTRLRNQDWQYLLANVRIDRSHPCLECVNPPLLVHAVYHWIERNDIPNFGVW